jgi:hypothetical protein
MQSWWSSNWLTVLTTLAGIVAGSLVTFLVARKVHPPKTLDYSLLSKIPIIPPRIHAASRRLSAPLSISSGEAGVQDPYLFTVRIANTGRYAIPREEYVDSITVSCSESQPIDGFVSASKPEALDVTGGPPLFNPTTRDLLTLRPPLLNAREWFEIQLLSDGNPGEVSVYARFKDQSRPVRNMRSEGRRRRMLGLGLLLLIQISLLFYSIFSSPANPVTLMISSLAVTVVAASFVFALVIVWNR